MADGDGPAAERLGDVGEVRRDFTDGFRNHGHARLRRPSPGERGMTRLLEHRRSYLYQGGLDDRHLAQAVARARNSGPPS